jgi:hypothetical protein
MANPPNPEDALEPMFHGMPVLVRLTTREDILCILFQSRDEEESRLFMERPLRIIMDELVPEQSAQGAAGHTKTVYSTVRTRFDRWIPFTTALIFPIYPEHVLSIAPLADAYTNSYMEWADQLYEQSSPMSAQRETAPTLPDDSLENIRRSYIDYLLHNFTHKGKPH